VLKLTATPLRPRLAVVGSLALALGGLTIGYQQNQIKQKEVEDVQE